MRSFFSRTGHHPTSKPSDDDGDGDGDNHQIGINVKLAVLKRSDRNPLEGSVHSTIVDDVVS